jgi:hypothetical protein
MIEEAALEQFDRSESPKSSANSANRHRRKSSSGSFLGSDSGEAQHITPEKGNKGSSKKPTPTKEDSFEEGGEGEDDDDSEAFEFDLPSRRGRTNSLNELNKHGLFLNSQLENEIKGLTKSINEQETGSKLSTVVDLFVYPVTSYFSLALSLPLHVSALSVETRTAHASAQTYAEKYIKLREEYELHVQVLMLKLTQEQQARTLIEDKLEDAYVSCFVLVVLSFLPFCSF